MTTAAADRPTFSRAQHRKAIAAGVIGNVLEWYDFGWRRPARAGVLS